MKIEEKDQEVETAEERTEQETIKKGPEVEAEAEVEIETENAKDLNVPEITEVAVVTDRIEIKAGKNIGNEIDIEKGDCPFNLFYLFTLPRK